MLSVIIPVYNEASTIRELLAKVRAVDIEKEILIVDDGSTDGTRDILVELEGPGIQVILHKNNKGKGGAIRTALPLCSGEVVIIQDADLEYDPNDYHALLEPVASGRYEVVYGSRILKTDNPRGGLMFYLGGRLVSLFTNLLFGSKLTDEATCYKVFKRTTIQGLKLTRSGFDLEPEITAKLLRQGIEIGEVPISYFPRSTDEGKKINARDGIVTLWCLLRYRPLEIIGLTGDEGPFGDIGPSPCRMSHAARARPLSPASNQAAAISRAIAPAFSK
jgi:dolichol-phosphate mannosyltransferase